LPACIAILENAAKNGRLGAAEIPMLCTVLEHEIKVIEHLEESETETERERAHEIRRHPDFSHYFNPSLWSAGLLEKEPPQTVGQFVLWLILWGIAFWTFAGVSLMLGETHVLKFPTSTLVSLIAILPTRVVYNLRYKGELALIDACAFVRDISFMLTMCSLFPGAIVLVFGIAAVGFTWLFQGSVRGLAWVQYALLFYIYCIGLIAALQLVVWRFGHRVYLRIGGNVT